MILEAIGWFFVVLWFISGGCTLISIIVNVVRMFTQKDSLGNDTPYLMALLISTLTFAISHIAMFIIAKMLEVTI